MNMTTCQSIITILIVIFGTMLTRFLPFIIFPADKNTPLYIRFLGKVLPYAVIGLLVIYCLKDVSLFYGTYGIPEMLAIVSIIFLHIWKRNTLISIVIGTIIYMILIQFIFI